MTVSAVGYGFTVAVVPIAFIRSNGSDFAARNKPARHTFFKPAVINIVNSCGAVGYIYRGRKLALGFILVIRNERIAEQYAVVRACHVYYADICGLARRRLG